MTMFSNVWLTVPHNISRGGVGEKGGWDDDVL